MALLEINDLTISFPSEEARVSVVRNMSLSLNDGETHCLVGESGCGKSVTSMAILGLLRGDGRIESGSIRFNGEELLSKTEKEMRTIRGNQIAMIFQDPMNSLNPVYRCGDQVAEAICQHKGVKPKEALKQTVALFKQVKIPDPERRVLEYPHQLSGGMRQRVMIAMALACEPKLLIADEPTTALDVTVQAQILKLIAELQSKLNMAVLFITHDLGVVAQIAHEVTVLYAGQVVENGSAQELFAKPRHPYTHGLLGAIPQMGQKKQRLTAIEGQVPDPSSITGCAFASRCSRVESQCTKTAPPQSTDGTHHFYCYYPGGDSVTRS